MLIHGSCRRALLWGALGAMYLVPVIAMLIAGDTQWTPFDFAAAALLLGGLGLAIELAIRFGPSSRARWMLASASVLMAAAIWADGAVGIF